MKAKLQVTVYDRQGNIEDGLSASITDTIARMSMRKSINALHKLVENGRHTITFELDNYKYKIQMWYLCKIRIEIDRYTIYGERNGGDTLHYNVCDNKQISLFRELLKSILE